VLPAIAAKVKGKLVLLADGAVHYGHDVLKYQALGADAVLLGRHLIRAAHGGGAAGVALFIQTMRGELEAAMTLTGTASSRSVTRAILA
jgi:isopentenyl diphosphate isomerase/L-lactate dehydrogenase-like FMN-dependent dehydrogenase